jgi:hypothetical protein
MGSLIAGEPVLADDVAIEREGIMDWWTARYALNPLSSRRERMCIQIHRQ